MLKAQLIRLHKSIAWFAGFGFFCFAISGILHPVMSWTGPQIINRQPPQGLFHTKDIQGFIQLADTFQWQQVTHLQLVPGPDGNLLQVTLDPKQPRLYFDIEQQTQLEDYDAPYAEWLAAHYYGKYTEHQQGTVKIDPNQTKFLTQFQSEYPWIHRLLPVYKVVITSEESPVHLFIDTQLGVVASITDETKANFQKWFELLHTWSWLDEIPQFRFVLVFTVLMTCCLLLSSGIYLLLNFKRHQTLPSQKWHRRFAAIVFIPIGLLLLSGFYHFLYNEVSPNELEFQAPKPFNIAQLGLNQHLSDTVADVQYLLANMSVIHMGVPLLRITQAEAEQVSVQARYQGGATHEAVSYLNLKTGKLEQQLTEKDIAEYFLKQHLPEGKSIHSLKFISRFGDGYDFRNKRLPVWRATLDEGSYLFIDNATGAKIDLVSLSAQYENFSFSYLHKFNLLTPVLGRFNRDLVLVTVMVLTLLLACLGFWRLYKMRSKQQQPEPLTSQLSN